MQLPRDNVALKKTTPPGKEVPDAPLTVDMARRIVGDVLERRDHMPKRKSAEDEIDDLVDDLDEIEDEDEEDEEVEEDEDEEDDEDEGDEDDEDEEEDDPDEKPKRSKSKGKTAAKKKPSGIGTKEVADAAGIEPRTLRMYLRKRGIQPRDDRDGRYTWPSLKDREVQRILKDIEKGAAAEDAKEKLAQLKGRKSKKSTAKKSTKKRTKVRSQKK